MSASVLARIGADAVAQLNASASKPVGAPDTELGRGALSSAVVPGALVYVRQVAMRRATSRASSPLNACTALIEVEIRVSCSASENPYEVVDPWLQWAATLDGARLDGAYDPAVQTGVVFTHDTKTKDGHVLATASFEVLYTQAVGNATRAS